jgi:hypothetical protein
MTAATGWPSRSNLAVAPGITPERSKIGALEGLARAPLKLVTLSSLTPESVPASSAGAAGVAATVTVRAGVRSLVLPR